MKAIGRNTVYGNPCSKQGRKCGVCGQIHVNAGDSLQCYRKYLWGRIQNESWAVEVARKAGVPIDEKRMFGHQVLDLRCEKFFCPGCKKGSKTCHGTVLERALIWLATEWELG